MATTLPDISALDWSPKLAGRLERAAQAIGRLDARITATSVRGMWLERASWTGFAEARRGQGAEIDEIDVFALATDSTLPGRRPIAFAAEERTALATWQRRIADAGSPHWRELVPSTVDLPSDWGERPALLRALELTAVRLRADRSEAGWLGMPFLLKALGITRTPLPCLVAADKALRLAPRDRTAIVPRYLKALAKAAEQGLTRLDNIEADRIRAAEAVALTRRPASLLSLLGLLRKRPVLTPLGTARALKLTVSGAGKLLSRAADVGLVAEITGRQAWRAYIPVDLALAFGFWQRRVGRPPALHDPGPLDPVLARFDAEMAAIDARLAALGVAQLEAVNG